MSDVFRTEKSKKIQKSRPQNADLLFLCRCQEGAAPGEGEGLSSGGTASRGQTWRGLLCLARRVVRRVGAAVAGVAVVRHLLGAVTRLLRLRRRVRVRRRHGLGAGRGGLRRSRRGLAGHRHRRIGRRAAAGAGRAAACSALGETQRRSAGEGQGGNRNNQLLHQMDSFALRCTPKESLSCRHHLR
ncbi:hypothetical protein FP568_01550 [Pandoraea pnomenusa]|nr:hypothetical protein FP568_01550 [Pandoraea pnomenusa]